MIMFWRSVSATCGCALRGLYCVEDGLGWLQRRLWNLDWVATGRATGRDRDLPF